jgi:GNAT superfamily N-acetyltransferase
MQAKTSPQIYVCSTRCHMDVAYRPARPEDLEPSGRIVQQAILDLRRQDGVALPQPLGPPAFQRFCFEDDLSGLWVAEADGELVGWTMSWMCGRFWFLSQLFVRPDLQAKGVGQALLDRPLAQAARREATNRALITFAYNTRATGLYVRNGMYPRVPLCFMAAPAAALPTDLGDGEYETEEIGPTAEALAGLGEIDAAVLGFRRDAHHAFLLGDGTARGFRIVRTGRMAGYAYVMPNGRVGPLAVAPGEDQAAVVGAALRQALQAVQPEHVTMIVPGTAERMLGAVSTLGFRIEEPLVLLSAVPFGDWQNYAPSNPGYM